MPTFPVPDANGIVVPIPRAVSYKHIQSTPALVWTITHDLGFQPAGFYCEDSAGTQHDPWIDYPDNNTVILTFLGATDGFALFS